MAKLQDKNLEMAELRHAFAVFAPSIQIQPGERTVLPDLLVLIIDKSVVTISHFLHQ